MRTNFVDESSVPQVVEINGVLGDRNAVIKVLYAQMRTKRSRGSKQYREAIIKNTTVVLKIHTESRIEP